MVAIKSLARALHRHKAGTTTASGAYTKISRWMVGKLYVPVIDCLINCMRYVRT